MYTSSTDTWALVQDSRELKGQSQLIDKRVMTVLAWRSRFDFLKERGS